MSRTHILFSASAGGTLKQLLRARGIQDAVISLHEYLDWGPIDCPLKDREGWIDSNSPSDIGWDWLAESVEKFRAAAGAVERPLIWIAPGSANELSGLYWYLDQLRPSDAEFLVADFPIVGHWRNETPSTLGQLSVELLGQVFERPPETWNKNRFRSERWSELVREKALLRIAKFGELQSVDSDYFDEIILRHCPAAWAKWHRIVGDTMGDAWEAGHYPDDSLLKWRLNELVRSGALEVHGDLSLHGVDRAARLRRSV